MPKLIIDRATLARLNHLKEHSEICDEQGRTLGFFRPTPRQHAPISPSSREPQITEEELLRREKEGHGRPLTDVVAELEKM